jgi:hypothetical protein
MSQIGSPTDGPTRVPDIHKTIWAKAMVPPLAVDQVAFSNYPWDDGTSMDELDYAVARSNNRAGTYSESANNAAFRFGVRFLTTEQYHKSKLLKILSDTCWTNIVSTLLLLGIHSINALLAHSIALNQAAAA